MIFTPGILVDHSSTLARSTFEIEEQPALNTIGGLARSIFSLYQMGREAGFHLLGAATQRTVRLFQLTQLTSGVSAATSAKDLISNTTDLYHNPTPSTFGDRTLTVIGDAASVGDSVATAAAGLVDAEALSSSAMNWANPLGLAAALVSSVFLEINRRGIVHGKALLETIQQKTKSVSEAVLGKEFILQKYIGLAKDSRFFKLSEAELNSDSVAAALSRRISQKITSHKLGALCGVIGITATIALTFSKERAVKFASYASLAGASIVSLYKQGYDKNCSEQFEAALPS